VFVRQCMLYKSCRLSSVMYNRMMLSVVGCGGGVISNALVRCR